MAYLTVCPLCKQRCEGGPQAPLHRCTPATPVPLTQAVQRFLDELAADQPWRADHNAPGHCHGIPGVWDDGDRRCALCDAWGDLRAALAAPAVDPLREAAARLAVAARQAHDAAQTATHPASLLRQADRYGQAAAVCGELATQNSSPADPGCTRDPRHSNP